MTYQETYDRIKSAIDLKLKYSEPERIDNYVGGTLIWRFEMLDVIRYPNYEGCHYSERNPPEYAKPFWNAILKIAKSEKYKDYLFKFTDIRFSFWYRGQFTIEKHVLT